MGSLLPAPFWMAPYFVKNTQVTTSLHPYHTGVKKGSTLRKATYAASAWSTGLDYGASYGCASDDPALIVTRANEAAKFGEGASGWSGYSLLTNNCETFAYWCSTGRLVMANAIAYQVIDPCTFMRRFVTTPTKPDPLVFRRLARLTKQDVC